MRRRLVLLGVVAALTLGGCTADDPQPEPSTPSDVATPSPSASEPDETVAACGAVSFTAGDTVSGAALGACVEGVIDAANSYRGAIESSDGSSGTALIRSSPLLIATEDSTGTAVYIDDEQRWLRAAEGSWVRAREGSDDPEVVMAQSVTTVAAQAWRADATAGAITAAGEWEVVGEREGSDADGGSLVGTRFEPLAPFTVAGVTMTDSYLLLRSDGTIVESGGTGTVAGIATTTVQRYAGWGEEQDWPEPPEE